MDLASFSGSWSIGLVTAEHYQQETLQDLHAYAALV